MILLPFVFAKYYQCVNYNYERAGCSCLYPMFVIAFHFDSFSYMPTVHVVLNLHRFECVFTYKVVPYLILNMYKAITNL